MATKRKRGDTWHYVVRRAHVLPRPLYLSFDDEAEGDAYVENLERLIDAGIVPAEFQKQDAPKLLRELIREYLKSTAAVSDMDRKLLEVVIREKGATALTRIDDAWCETWVSEMKRVLHRAPSTIRHHVGAVSRCISWGVRKRHMVSNPITLLPKGYSTYTEDDLGVVPAERQPGPGHRDRRIEPGELERILRVLVENPKPEGKERPLALYHRDALLLIFMLALGSGMRLSEIFTLELDQIDLAQRTIFLDRSKNGDKRQVPIFPRARVTLERYLAKIDPAQRYLVPHWTGGDREERKRVGDQLSKQFGRIFAAAGCSDLTFHDIRHEATCWIYEHTDLSDVEISKALGWKTLDMALRYANLRATKLAHDARVIAADEHQALVERTLVSGTV